MPSRPAVLKTYKLYINGVFPRSESGRSIPVEDGQGRVLAHVSHASRKDLRDAVEAAAGAQPGWAAATAYNRGQVLYRMAEMLEGRRDEFAALLGETSKSLNVKTSKGRRSRPAASRLASAEVRASIDRLVCFAGWADKFAQVLGCQNPVAGPYYNFTAPEPTGIVGVVAPDSPALLGLVSLMAPALCAGNAVVAIAGESNPLPGAVLGEVCATADVPAGVVNILTGRRDELLEHLANHGEVNAIVAANIAKPQAAILKLGAAENLKRVHVATMSNEDWHDAAICESPATIERVVEMKTIWHPSASQ